MKKTSGMTLVEILVAMAILALLMAATMRIMVHLPQNSDALAQKLAQRQWQTAVCALIEQDLWHASQCIPTAKGLQLETGVSIDPESLRFSHLPTTVEYACTMRNGESWLYRQESNKDQPPQKQWVCRGVSQITTFQEEKEADSTPERPQEYIVLEFSDPAVAPLQILLQVGP